MKHLRVAACMLMLALVGCDNNNEKSTTAAKPDAPAPQTAPAKDKAQLEKLMQQNIDQLNTEMPGYSKVTCFKLYQEEFEKTPKRSIKRYLYQPAEEN